MHALRRTAWLFTGLLACGAPNGSGDAIGPVAREPAQEVAIVKEAVALPSASTSAEAPTPRVAPPATVSLSVTGFADAVLAVPVGAGDARPLVIASHGNFDRPEWQCDVWSKIFRGRVFVLCPRGVARPDAPAADDPRFTYPHNRELEREVDAALAALRGSPYAPFVAEGPATWAGFSLGAIMGVAIAERRANDFATLLLVEGGVDRFRDDTARAFAKGGGRRVLFVCAQRGCTSSAGPRAKALMRAGLEARVVDAGNVGHAYTGPVADAVARELPDFLAADHRFDSVFAGH